jgi:glucose/arabinose dehydrogenase
MTGFLVDDGILGRPVAITQDQQGRFYVTDDFGGRVYRIQATQ